MYLIYTDTRPLLIFCADSVSIRAVAWAPVERLAMLRDHISLETLISFLFVELLSFLLSLLHSDQEGANVIVTAGHGGLKFWDIR